MTKYAIKLLKGTRSKTIELDSETVEGIKTRAEAIAKAEGCTILAIYEMVKVA